MKTITLFFFACILSKITFAQKWQLILNDPDKGAPTNVRIKPGGTVINTIDSRDELAVIDIQGKDGNYFLVSGYEYCGRNKVKLPRVGYIHYSVLGVSISNYGSKPIPIYGSETKGIPIKKVTYSDEFVNVLDKINDMYLVLRLRSKEKFWIESKYICLSACTNCN